MVICVFLELMHSINHSMASLVVKKLSSVPVSALRPCGCNCEYFA